MNLKLCLAAALLAAAGAASAENDPAAYLFSPVVEQGEREIDSKAGIARGRDGRSFWGGKFGVEYGVTDWWSAEATVNFGREVGESFNILSLEWENRFQFTETGAQPYELGFLFEVEKERESAEGWELRYGPLLQWQHGGLQANLNLLFERRLGADGPREKTGLGYQWQLRWHGGAALDFGAQGFGALGPWDGWARRAEQSHILGPALFAQLGEDDDDGEAEAALLFGTGGAAPTLTLRVQAMIPF
jgi:hypothetical protein